MTCSHSARGEEGPDHAIGMLLRLEAELVELVLSLLPALDLASSSITCRAFRDAAKQATRIRLAREYQIQLLASPTPAADLATLAGPAWWLLFTEDLTTTRSKQLLDSALTHGYRPVLDLEACLDALRMQPADIPTREAEEEDDPELAMAIRESLRIAARQAEAARVDAVVKWMPRSESTRNVCKRVIWLLFWTTACVQDAVVSHVLVSDWPSTDELVCRRWSLCKLALRQLTRLPSAALGVHATAVMRVLTAVIAPGAALRTAAHVMGCMPAAILRSHVESIRSVANAHIASDFLRPASEQVAGTMFALLDHVEEVHG